MLKTKDPLRVGPMIYTQRSLLNVGAQNGGTDRTGKYQGYSNTHKNWRSLVTPAHDSFKKLEKGRRPGMEYSSTQ